LLQDKERFNKTLIFVANKRMADRLFEKLDEQFHDELCVIHSNKTQNYRLRSIEQFRTGMNRILVATDVMARGLDIDNVSHVINFDTPNYPENYMHRIGRTGRAEREGEAIVFTTESDTEAIENIELLMNMSIPVLELPDTVEISDQLIEEERPQIKERNNPNRKPEDVGPAFHEKSEKNKKENLGGSYKFKIAEKYKKPKTRGDKNYNKRNKKK
jgi:ATP-dependent RNA helicase RhlE